MDEEEVQRLSGEDMPELKEWEADPPSAKNAVFNADSQWELTFLYFCVLLFSVWFGIIGQKFENIMSFCMIAVVVGFVIYLAGRTASEPILRENTKQLFGITLFFSFTVCMFHFLRLKIDPPSQFI